MIVGFFGHSTFFSEDITVEKVVALLEKETNCSDVDFYLGNYGNFDNFAYNVAKEYQKRHAKSKLIFITPYLNNVRGNDFAKKCDYSIYPEIEKVPLRYAIIERNKWVVQNSDLLIFYCKIIGSTRTIYEYAIYKNKRVINLVEQFF